MRQDVVLCSVQQITLVTLGDGGKPLRLPDSIFGMSLPIW